MSLGSTPRQGDVFRSTTEFCAPRVPADSIHALLHRECFSLFPDDLFADLFADVGRRSVPPLIVAVVMVLQRLEGLSDREAVERFTYDARWKYAAGGLPFDHPGFAHTVLVDMRARLARSARPTRIFEVTLGVARQAGLVGVRRVLDSTPLYDAVATMDTVSLVRSAIRGLLAVAGDREPCLRALLRRDDDYRSAGKPACDWEDTDARAALVDALARDGQALLDALDGAPLLPALGQAATLLATVLGQDLEDGDDGVIRIARRVAHDRVISTVDPDARHGHKTNARSFDGYKGHLALDPDAELITATAVTPGNAGDAVVVPELLVDDLAPHRVWRLGVRNRPGARDARGPRRRQPVQGPALTRAARPLLQGRLRGRPRDPDGDLPGGPGGSVPGSGRALCRIRTGLRRLSTGRPLYDLAAWSDDRDRTPRGAPLTGPRRGA